MYMYICTTKSLVSIILPVESIILNLSNFWNCSDVPASARHDILGTDCKTRHGKSLRHGTARNSGSGIQDPGSRVRDPGSWILDPGSGIQDPESWILNPGFRIKDSGSFIRIYDFRNISFRHGSARKFWHGFYSAQTDTARHGTEHRAVVKHLGVRVENQIPYHSNFQDYHSNFPSQFPRLSSQFPPLQM